LANATARSNSGGAIRHIVHSLTPIAAAKRADSIPIASPQRVHSTSCPARCSSTRATQASHTLTRPSPAIAKPQIRQSVGKTVFVTSATASAKVPPIAARLLRSTRVTARNPDAAP
jgi:hypothetical protein